MWGCIVSHPIIDSGSGQPIERLVSALLFIKRMIRIRGLGRNQVIKETHCENTHLETIIR